ncbi:hypothetical protein CJY_0016 [Vibrio phage CJY]|uniref:Uncharacterized protein n=1 Tax=Vibrio phage J2 TaxID=1558467 RepID=A0A0A7HAF7_9CAUD|nr:hypothetical protein ACQ42_gp16 [Vibrio phage J2]AIZ01415.1 hypothetical protein CJY_0016 [Vibrio phage CJY]AIZ01463.1 hypothetical protein H1_0016 [Vibrio phage H1]AIZ01511.1 hypothetical protein H2_0016 [Vibrio phage H2 SGB-2014]AIZ01559.1 hypothetical protein H3_0016 [Vibrio phage H3]AIZ01655.1 hypothetical protein J3_0016 [Vibrio phage J3]
MKISTATAAGAGLGAAFGAIGGLKAKGLMDREAELRWLATQEEVRKMEKTHNQIIGQAEADLGSSGFASNSASQRSLIEDTRMEMDKQRALMLAFGKTQNKIDKAASNEALKGSILSGISSGISFGSTVGDWFK